MVCAAHIERSVILCEGNVNSRLIVYKFTWCTFSDIRTHWMQYSQLSSFGKKWSKWRFFLLNLDRRLILTCAQIPGAFLAQNILQQMVLNSTLAMVDTKLRQSLRQEHYGNVLEVDSLSKHHRTSTEVYPTQSEIDISVKFPQARSVNFIGN